MSIGAEDGLTNVSGTISTEIFSTLLPQTQSLKLKVHKTNMYHIWIVKNVIFAKVSCAGYHHFRLSILFRSFILQTIGIKDIFRVNTFEIAKFMFDYHNYLFPTLLLNLFITNGQIHRYCTRGASNYQTHLCRTNLKQFTILYRGPKIWNSLSVSVTLQVFLVLWRRCDSFYSKITELAKRHIHSSYFLNILLWVVAFPTSPEASWGLLAF